MNARKSESIKKKAPLALLLILVSIAGIYFYWKRVAQAERALTEAPKRYAEVGKTSPVTSSVLIPILLESEGMSQVANTLVPSSISIPERQIARKRILRVTVTEVSMSGAINRTKPIAISAAGDGLNVTTEISANVTARGRVLRAQIARQTLRGSAAIAAHMVFDVDQDWTPTVTLTPVEGASNFYQWTDRPHVNIGGVVELSLGSEAEGIINPQINSAKQRLSTAVREGLPLKKIMEEAWQDGHAVVQVSNEPAAWVSIDPVGTFFLPPVANNEGLVLNVGVLANLQLSSTKPAVPLAEPLPSLNKQKPSIEGFRIAVPVELEYEVIASSLVKQLSGKPIIVDTDQGSVTVKINDINIYPSGARLVVGANVSADLPHSFLDTNGWVYLYATPFYDPKTNSLKLNNLSFSRSIDNDLTSFLTAAFQQQINSELQKMASVDVKKQLTMATQQGNILINKTIEESLRKGLANDDKVIAQVLVGVDVVGKLDGVQKVDIVVGPYALTIVPVVTGNIGIQMRPRFGQPTQTNSDQSAVGIASPAK